MSARCLEGAACVALFAPFAAAQCALQWSAGTQGGAVLVTLANGDVTNGAARFDGTTWTPFGSGLAGGGAGDVAELPNGDLVVVGAFTSAGGVPAPGIARWDGVAWHALPAPSTSMALQFVAALPNGDIAVLGGIMPNPVSQTTFVEYWNGTSWQLIGTSLGATGSLPYSRAVALDVLPSGELVAFGSWYVMQPVGNVGAYNELVRWDGTAWHRLGDFPDPSALLVAREGSVYAGTRFGVSRFDGVWTWLGGGTGGGGDVLALAELPDGSIVAGGRVFPAAQSIGLQRWNGSWSVLGPIDPVGGAIIAVAMHGSGRLLVSGNFSAAGGVPVMGSALLTTTCPASVTTAPVACVGPAGPLALAATALPWVGGTFRSTATGFAASSLAVAIVGLGQQQLPLASLHPSGLPNCDLLATGDAVVLVAPAGGVAGYSFPIPNHAALAGVTLQHQFLQGELGAPGLVSLSSSNRLTLHVGVF